MRSRTYLNAILTINAFLLAALIWVQVATREPATPAAHAQQQGFVNAAAQRKMMINAIEAMQQSVEASNRLLESGKLRVQVTNLDEIRIEAPPSQR